MTNEYYGAHTDLVPGTKARSGDINAMDQAIVEAFDKLPSARAMKSGTMNYVVNTSSTVNSYAVTMDGTIVSYTDGLEVKLRPVLDNTGPATLNVNGIGNVAIKRQDGTSVLAGDILANGPLAVVYNANTSAFVIGPTGNAHVKAAAASADAAGQSASAANSSASTASNASATAVTKAGEAATSAATASTKATEASNSANTASTKAGEASASATAAATSATSAASSVQTLAAAVTSATASAGTATTKASEASQSAASAATSATNLTNAVSAAQAAQSLAQQWASGTGIIASGKYSAEYYANQAANSAAAVTNGQVNADWNATSGAALILNKPSITTAGAFATGAANSIAANTNALRAITNPTTGLGYAGGVRFRFAYANDADTTQGYADVVDLSTYTDNTGGGVNALYFNKTTQRIGHKFAGAGATAWTTQTLAYLSDLSAYLPKAGGSMTGPILINAAAQQGIFTAKGTIATVSNDEAFVGQITPGASDTLILSSYKATGSAIALWTSNSVGNGIERMRINAAGNVLMGTTTEDGSGARLQVAGGISSPQGFIGNASSATTATTATNAANADKLGGLPLAAAGTGGAWPAIPRINSDGVMEVGSILDFHNASADGLDQSVRLNTSGTTDLLINGNKIFTAGINRTNYKGVTDGFVAGQLMWKKYGNNYTIFDASAGTAPDGSAIDPNNAASGWAASDRPNLMGWNGVTTCGVRVDSARVADTIGAGATLTNAVLVKPTFKNYIEQLQALNPGAAVTLNTDNGTLIELTTTVTSTTITLPAAVAGASYTLMVKYGATGHTLAFTGGGLRWANGNTVPNATSVAGKIDAYVFTCGTGYTVGRDGWRNA